MKYAYLPDYGYAMCPHCRKEFNVVGSTPAFAEKCSHNDHALYVMCPECAERFRAGSNETIKAMGDRCFINFKTEGSQADGKLYPWAVTTLLALAMNDNDLVKAIEHGHGLSKAEYFGVCSGKYQIWEFPDGQRAIKVAVQGGL